MTALQLRPYQVAAVQWLHQHPRGALFLEMGLGKTASVLRALTPAHLPVLVVAPKRVAEEVWPVESDLWRPDLRVALAVGGKAARAAALRSGADVVVISRDNMTDAVPLAPQFRTLVLDELSSFKSYRTARWKAAKVLATAALHVWGLTGTPAPNGLLDLWSQVYLLDLGVALGRRITHYRDRYFTVGKFKSGRPAIMPNGVITAWELKPGAALAIHRKLDTFCLSMSNDGLVDLPPVTYNRVRVQLPAKVRHLYRKLRLDLVADLALLGGTDQVISTPNAATLTGRLQQLAAGFVYGDDDGTGRQPTTRLHTAKLDALQEIVEGTGSPVLVFYRFKEELAMLQGQFPQARLITETGIIKEWNAGQVPLLLAHPASASHGLNLQHGGHTMVWTTLPWSLEEWLQANARLARSGQQHPVVIHTLEAAGTVDEDVAAALVAKEDVQQALLTHLEGLL